MSALKPPLSPRDHQRGAPLAPIRLVEFGDYECPFCRQAHESVTALTNALGARILFAFRHFPLVNVHPHAELAAEAAEAAGAQGKFWDMHDLLYANQRALGLQDIERYARTLDLDMRRFTGDLQGHRHREKIRADVHSGAISGVGGTPTFYINGRRHEAGYDVDSLLDAMAIVTTGRAAAHG
jgi:protein-disulfide isomerase